MFNTNTANVPTKRSIWLSPGLLIPLIGALFLAIFVFSNYVKFNDLGVSTENSIEAQYTANQNFLGQQTLKVKESLGVAKLETKALDSIIRGALEGRYGSDGEGAKQAMLWVQEQYPGAYSNALYVNVQQTILAGRTDFQVKQDLLTDKVAAYKTLTESVWSGFWLKLAGFPRSTFKFEKYAPVLAEGTKEIFQNKVDPGITIE